MQQPATQNQTFTQSDLLAIFKYDHNPNDNLRSKYERVSQAALEFSKVIQANTPPGPDQTAAILEVRSAVLIATNPMGVWG